jgi:aminopeptidase YwaD
MIIRIDNKGAELQNKLHPVTIPGGARGLPCLVLTLAGLAITVAACSGGSASAPTPTAEPPAPTPATPMATATVELGPGEPEQARMLEHIQALAGDIGIRPSGSAANDRAVEYAREQLTSWGYNVEVQRFTASAADPSVLRFASLSRGGSEDMLAVAFSGARTASVTGRLVDAGNGNEGDFPREANGAIALVQRGTVTFADMAGRAADAGATAVVVANREPGLFPAEVPAGSPPMIAISQADGDTLRKEMASGPLEVTVRIALETSASNVIARPSGTTACRTLSGGHIDSVPWAPGATDNASGSALVLELARAAAAAGLRDHCFVLFGAEEVGLEGSAHLAALLSDAERGALQAVFDYDVVAGDVRPAVAGREELIQRAQATAATLGTSLDRAGAPEDIPSDHLSFLREDIGAIIITTPDYELIHTPNDIVANLTPAYLQVIADLGIALIRSFDAPAP